MDSAFLGFAEVNPMGDINVSHFGGRFAGCGGFIDISQPTKRVFFVGTLTSGGLVESVRDGKLVIEREGSRKKFIKSIEQTTFNAAYGLEKGQDITFITDRCVMKPTEKGLMITEIAPGIDIQKDILDQMDFAPLISEDVIEMDPRIFREETMNLRA